MAKKRRVAPEDAAGAEPEPEGQQTEVERTGPDSAEQQAPPLKKKKKKKAAPEAAPPDELAKEEQEGQTEAEEETKRKKKKKKAPVHAAAEEEQDVDAQERELDEQAPKKKRKKQHVEVEAEANGDEEANQSEDVGPSTEKTKKKGEKRQEKGVAETAKTAGESAESAEPFTVFVGGIPWSVEEDVLRKDFEECGEVTDVHILVNHETGNSRGIGFVTFATEAGLQAALKYDGDDYGGRRLEVRRAEARGAKGGKGGKVGKGGKDDRGKGGGTEFEVFIKGIPADTTEDDLQKLFSPCGAIDKLSMPTRGSGLNKGFAWIGFLTKEGFDKALELNGKECGKSKLLVEKSGQHKAASDGDGKGKGKGKSKGKAKGKGKGSSENEVFVSNLSFETTQADLKEDFLVCGEIERMHMPTKGENKCMGFAWITFKTKDGLEKALEYDGDDYGGRRLKVEKSGQHGGRKLREKEVPDAEPA